MSAPTTLGTYIQFGAGYIYALNVGGPTLTTPGQGIVPVRLATIQDASVEFAFTLKELSGNLEFPEDVASASKKITGKLTTGRFDLNLLNQTVFGEALAVGAGTGIINGEANTILTSHTYTVVDSATFVQDLGVYYSATGAAPGRQLIPVASSPAVGQYSVAAGVYTFNTAEITTAGTLLFNYSFTQTTGYQLPINNKIMGNSRPVFQLYLSQPYQGNNDLILYSCRASKLNMPEKREDYVILEIDFEAYANAGQQVGAFTSAA
jgi:hypothetical protein